VNTGHSVEADPIWVIDVSYPIILDLLEAAGVTWKVYNIGWDSVPYGNTDNVFVFWERWAHDKRTLGTKGSFLNDLRRGRLPQVSWIIPSYARGWDEHPPADVSIGMGIQEELVTALRESSAWDSSCGVRKVGSRCKSEYFVSRTEFYAPHRPEVSSRVDGEGACLQAFSSYRQHVRLASRT
jgi:hypothetical protein